VARRVLDAAGRALVGGWVVEGKSNTFILERLAELGYDAVTTQALTHYRRKLFPETVARDLEAVQGGAAGFQERIQSLVAQIRACALHAITPEGALSDEKGAIFALKVAAELARELSSVLKSCDDRFFRLEKLELEKAASVRAEAAEKRAQESHAWERERWQIEKALIQREMLLLDKEEEASLEGVELGEV
jgi:hypothetical protein